MLQIPAPLEQFLAHLPSAGIPVGVHELHRLRRVCTLQPSLDRQGWHDTLCCLLAKTSAQRQAFDDAFDAWYLDDPPPAEDLLADDSAPEEPPDAAASQDQPAAVPPEPPSTAPPPRLIAERPQDSRTPDRPAPPATRLPSLVGVALLIGLIATLWSGRHLLWRPIPMQDSLFLLLGTALWGYAVWLWRRYQQRQAAPLAAPLDRTGPTWQSLPDWPHLGLALLTPDERRQMVWSIGRFVSDDHTRRLDVARTVQATACSGGLPVLHYQHAVYAREVWLWVDTATPDLAMQRLVWEVRSSLEQAGLPCRLGHFRELPDPVTWEEGESFTPVSLEGHRQGAMVLLFSNGEGLATAQDLAPERAALMTLLHALAGWPHLAWVDVSQGAWNLAGRLQDSGLACLAPADVPAFLGRDGATTAAHVTGHVPMAGDLKAWAAGLALSPDPVDAAGALALHQAMGLQVPAWYLTALHEHGVALGPGCFWSEPERAPWVNWLVQAEEIRGSVPDHSRLGLALAFWQARYPAAIATQPSPAEQRLAIEHALLDLWRAPEAAAQALYSIATADPNGLGLEIAQRLAAYVPRLVSAPGGLMRQASLFQLPWHWDTLSLPTQGLLYRLGLVERWLTAPPRYVPGTLALVLGIFGGVATGLLLYSGVVGLVLLAGLSVAIGLLARRWQRAHLETARAEPLDMVYIPGGTFTMGSALEDAQAYEDERPSHQVTVSDFFMARYLVTQPQYRRAMGQRTWEWRELHPRRRPWYRLHPRVPVIRVNWFYAIDLCNVLSDQQGLQRCYVREGNEVLWDQEADGYRLPTEAEWEYAARAGTITRWVCGDEATALGDYAWYSANARGHVHPVGAKHPNPWGLYDMAGNVYEWCWDWYAAGYDAAATTDPGGPPTGARRVLRGGAYWDGARNVRSARRDRREPERRDDAVGVRVVRRPRRQP